MSTSTLNGWRFTYEHAHCARCHALAAEAKSIAVCTGSLGAAQEERRFSAVDARGELTHAARADRVCHDATCVDSSHSSLSCYSKYLSLEVGEPDVVIMSREEWALSSSV